MESKPAEPEADGRTAEKMAAPLSGLASLAFLVKAHTRNSAAEKCRT